MALFDFGVYFFLLIRLNECIGGEEKQSNHEA